MNMFRNVSRYLFGDASKETIITIPQGQLYIVRPRSPKGYSELIFKDAAATIRRTGQDFQYQLVIQRAYEEGEEELSEDENGDDDIAQTLGAEKDEKTFLMDEQLRFRSEVRENGQKVLAWRDLSGDEDDLYEFVCDTALPVSEVASFEMIAAKCQYERKYRKSQDTATDAELERFNFSAQPIPSASPITTTSDNALLTYPTAREELEDTSATTELSTLMAKQTLAPAAQSAPPGAKDTIVTCRAELHLFDFESKDFVLQDPSVIATVADMGNWRYWLQISSEEQAWLGLEVTENINPVVNFEYTSFIFNHYTEDNSAYSWLLRFKDYETTETFQGGVMRALWEHLNHVKWTKNSKEEQEYVFEAFQDTPMEDAPDYVEEEEDEEEDVDDGKRSEHYDSDESADDVDTTPEDGNVNSQLAVGYKHDRSFVVRGSKIGVFKHTPNNNLEFSTNISKVQTPNGKLFSPTKVMLHQEDSHMILQNEENPHSLYRMDLEVGKVVDEWKISDDIKVSSFAPEKKFSQMTGESTFLGLSHNALFRIDPRLTSGDKITDSQLKQYVSKNDFSAAATTEKGYIAVASNKGDIRLFDRFGINAKTALLPLGEPIIDIDTSADGRWVLATCRTYLLLIDTLQKDGKNEGKLGFEKAFPKDSKPQPRRLALTPQHVAQFAHEMGSKLSFTAARFNTGVDTQETSIITATGPFIITWNMKKVLAGKKDAYTIKRYAEEVKADNFKYGSDKNVIVALPNEVNMVAKQSFKKVTRESLASPARPIRGSGRMSSKLRKSDVVQEY